MTTSPNPSNPWKTTFQAGDIVVYPPNGVGEVKGIEDLSVAGMTLKVIVVAFDEGATVLRIPVNKAESAGLRKFDRRIDSLKNTKQISTTKKDHTSLHYDNDKTKNIILNYKIKNPTNNKTIIYSAIILAMIAATLVAPRTRINFWGIYFSFEECVADRMRGVGSDTAAQAIAFACRNKFEIARNSVDITNMASNLNVVLAPIQFSSSGSYTLTVFHETQNYNISTITIRITDGVRSENYDCTSSSGVPPRTRGTLYCSIMRESFNTQSWNFSVSRVFGYRI